MSLARLNLNGDSYVEAHNMIRSITGTGAGKGPVMVIHDGFRSLTSYVGLLAGGDRIGLGAYTLFNRCAVQ